MISQIELLSVVLHELERQGVKSLYSKQYNEIIASINNIIEVAERKAVLTKPNMGLDAWLKSDDTGISSEFMAGVLSKTFYRKYGHPHDIDDFGRCMRLLVAVPELRSELSLMKAESKEWENFVNNWDDIESFIKEEKFKDASNLIKECLTVSIKSVR